MLARDRHGAAIRVGDPVLQRYPHREALKAQPFRGVVVRMWGEPARGRCVIEYREDGSEHLRNGDARTIEYDWHPPTDKETQEQRARVLEVINGS